MLLLVACGAPLSNDMKEVENIESSIIEENEINVREEVELERNKYADDDVVNQFIIDYNTISGSNFSDIEKGNIRTKYYAFTYGYYCELLNANDTNKINIKIWETNDNADVGVVGMKDVFHDVAKAIEPSLSDNIIYSFFDDLINQGVQQTSTLSTMEVLFSPDIDLSNGYSRGHIEVSAK